MLKLIIASIIFTLMAFAASAQKPSNIANLDNKQIHSLVGRGDYQERWEIFWRNAQNTIITLMKMKAIIT